MSFATNRRFISPQERMICSKVHALRRSETPYFAVYHESFNNILGSQPEIELALEKDYSFAHEAGVYLPEQDAIFVTSNLLQSTDTSEPTIRVSKIQHQSDTSWTCEELETGVIMGNGGVNYKSKVLFCDQGSKKHPGGLVVMDPDPPYRTITIADSFHGRLFNSVNDVVLHSDGSIWFTDPIYGFEQGFRNQPQLPCQVYRLDASSGDIRVVADGFGRPNGLCFSPDEKTLYITDTDWIHGDGTTHDMRASTIYAFDVIQRDDSHFLTNRRLFAMADSGVPDGIKCDTNGNVYSGCGDGINVWNIGGMLIGKIIVSGGIANFCFARKGELVLLNEHRLWIVTMNPLAHGALLANMNISVD